MNEPRVRLLLSRFIQWLDFPLPSSNRGSGVPQPPNQNLCVPDNSTQQSLALLPARSISICRRILQSVKSVGRRLLQVPPRPIIFWERLQPLLHCRSALTMLRASFPSFPPRALEGAAPQTSWPPPLSPPPRAPGSASAATGSISTSMNPAAAPGTSESWCGSIDTRFGSIDDDPDWGTTETPTTPPQEPLRLVFPAEGVSSTKEVFIMKRRGQSAAFLKGLRKKYKLGEFKNRSKRRARQTTRKVKTPVKRTYHRAPQYVLPKMGL